MIIQHLEHSVVKQAPNLDQCLAWRSLLCDLLSHMGEGWDHRCDWNEGILLMLSLHIQHYIPAYLRAAMNMPWFQTCPYKNKRKPRTAWLVFVLIYSKACEVLKHRHVGTLSCVTVIQCDSWGDTDTFICGFIFHMYVKFSVCLQDKHLSAQ